MSTAVAGAVSKTGLGSALVRCLSCLARRRSLLLLRFRLAARDEQIRLRVRGVSTRVAAFPPLHAPLAQAQRTRSAPARPHMPRASPPLRRRPTWRRAPPRSPPAPPAHLHTPRAVARTAPRCARKAQAARVRLAPPATHCRRRAEATPRAAPRQAHSCAALSPSPTVQLRRHQARPTRGPAATPGRLRASQAPRDLPAGCSRWPPHGQHAQPSRQAQQPAHAAGS